MERAVALNVGLATGHADRAPLERTAAGVAVAPLRIVARAGPVLLAASRLAADGGAPLAVFRRTTVGRIPDG